MCNAAPKVFTYAAYLSIVIKKVFTNAPKVFTNCLKLLIIDLKWSSIKAKTNAFNL